MASVTTLYDADGRPRAYKVRWWTTDGRPRSKTFPLKQKGAADRFAVGVEADKLAGAELDRRAERLTVSAYSAQWLAVQHHRPGTARRAATALGSLNAEVGGQLVGRVRPSDLKAWRKRRAAEVAAATLGTDWMWVRAMFAAAVLDRYAHVSPCDGIRAERTARAEIVIPTLEELDAVTARLPDRWAALVPVGAQTGLRPGELLGLCVDQVDFLRRRIIVDRQCRDGQVVFEPKTDSSRRVVPVDALTLDVLAAHLAAWPPAEAAVGERTVALVFHNAAGAPLHRRWVQAQWKRAVADALPGRRIRMHDLRHFYASALLAAGRPLVEVQKRLGHASTRELDTYAHLFEGNDDQTRAAVAKTFSARALGASRAPE